MVMKNKKISILILTLLVSGSYLFALDSGVGTTAANFLKIDAAARQSSMAGAFVAVGDDVNTIQYNPSGLSNLKKHELSATYVNYAAGLSYSYVGYLLPLPKTKIGFSGGSFGAKMREADAQGDELGEIIVGNAFYSLSVAKKYGDLLSWGFSFKAISSKVGKYNAWAYAGDLGAIYELPIEGISIGAALSNFGSKLKLLYEEDPLPKGFRIGIAKKLADPKLVLGLEANKYSDNNLMWNLGAEVFILKIIALRGGYKIGHDLNSYTLGTGIRMKPKGLDEFELDYAFNPMGELGNTHRFTLITRF
ncbi:MAG: hypothetical protein A2539_01465 [Elusimicrobia bacterium RIFOXYD2_FULL_34_15]|nr:MAG: hypothetical protein A2539_01465 [Elusimicrobia bacterium RIFOXYD2_FULL_34_15]